MARVSSPTAAKSSAGRRDPVASGERDAAQNRNASHNYFFLEKFEAGVTGLEKLAGPAIREQAPYEFRGKVPLIDGWLYARLAETLDVVKNAFATQRFHEAVQSIYRFFWNDFCDWYIEWIKPELTSADRERATIAWKNLFAAFEAALRLLHKNDGLVAAGDAWITLLGLAVMIAFNVWSKGRLRLFSVLIGIVS